MAEDHSTHQNDQPLALACAAVDVSAAAREELAPAALRRVILVDVGFVQVDVDVRLVLILSLQSRRIINEVGPLDIH